MASVKEIISFLRDKDFTEEELARYLDEMVADVAQNSADCAIFQFVKKKRDFTDKRNKRLRSEFRDFILDELNKDRQNIKLDRAQDVYKANRRRKKNQERRRKEARKS